MPLSVIKKLGRWQDMKPTPLTLQFADKSIVKLDGIIEDVCVRVDKFILPTEFIILEMKKDKEVPLILDRPFLATGDAWIGVKNKIIVFNFDGEKVIFDVHQTMKHPSEKMDRYNMNLVDHCVQEVLRTQEGSKGEGIDSRVERTPEKLENVVRSSEPRINNVANAGSKLAEEE